MEYIESHKNDERPDGCVFCALLSGKSGEERILGRSDAAFVALAKYPYNPGHLLVLPVRHTGDLEDLSEVEGAEISRLLKRCLHALRAVEEPHGFNVGLNLGRVA